MSRLVAGIDSSTQSCKVVIRDAETGRLLRHGEAPHPEGTEVDPHAWWEALCAALHQAGGLDDVAAVSVAAQQHGMVCLDDDGEVVRPALLWNDVRSAAATESLLRQAGAGEAGKAVWAKATGSVPVPSFTVTKLRWLAEHEPASARRTAAVALPHDWLTWRLAGSGAISELATDRSDASGTGYFAPATGEYLPQYLAAALGHDALLPRVLGPHEPAGSTPGGALLGPGAGDNAAAALSLGAGPADVIVSVGTSGTVCGVAEAPTADPTGMVAGFADATGEFLPLVCTLNAARVLDAATRLLGTEHAELDRLALSAPAGSGGLVLVPYLAGERTPSRPEATGSLHGLTLGTATPEHVARAAVEGMLCGLADGLDALAARGVAAKRVLLIGGGARSEAVRRIAPAVLARPVAVPPPGEYVADGAARQAAWVLSGQAAPPSWPGPEWATYRAAPAGGVRERYAAAREHVLPRTA